LTGKFPSDGNFHPVEICFSGQRFLQIAGGGKVAPESKALKKFFL